MILKQALCIASEQLHHYEFLVNAVAVIVFLSTPHSALVKENTFSHFMNVLKAATRKSIKIPDTRLERESSILQGLTNRFEGIFFRTPVLSVYETIDTKISDRIFRSRMQKVCSICTNSNCSTTVANSSPSARGRVDLQNQCANGEGLGIGPEPHADVPFQSIQESRCIPIEFLHCQCFEKCHRAHHYTTKGL